MLYIGSHTSYVKGKGLLGVVEETLSYNANIFMFYTGSNQSTLRFPIDKTLTKEAHDLMKLNNIDKTKCIVHAPFIINLANNTRVLQLVIFKMRFQPLFYRGLFLSTLFNFYVVLFCTMWYNIYGR